MNTDIRINQLLENEINLFRQDIVTTLQQAGKTATGHTTNAIQTSTRDKHATLEAPSYLFTLENGRGPARGSNSSKQQFIENLKEWIVAKGISYKDENDLQRLAGFFRWYINKFGTKQFRQGSRQDIITSAIDKLTQSVNEKIPKVYTNGLANIMK